jgi:hypothetical protein
MIGGGVTLKRTLRKAGAEIFAADAQILTMMPGVTELRRKRRHRRCVGPNGSRSMIDRQRLEALLANRFPGAARDQIAAAANAIMAMIRDAEPTNREPRARPREPRSSSCSQPMP